AQARADAADSSMPLAETDQKVRAVERGGTDADQHLVGLGLRLGQFADFDAVLANNCGFHDGSSRGLKSDCGITFLDELDFWRIANHTVPVGERQAVTWALYRPV